MPTPSRENPPFGATAVAAPGRDADTADAALGSVGAVDPDEALRFRAPTLEDAIAVAETALGARVRVIAANRIRRGGIGGFFASDLGVEVTVVVDDESIDDTFDRIVNATQTTTAPHPAPRRTPPAPLHAADLLLGRRFDRRDTAPSHDIDDVHDDVHTELHTEPHDDFRSVARHIEAEARPGDGLFLPNPLVRPQLDYQWLDGDHAPEGLIPMVPLDPIGSLPRFYEVPDVTDAELGDLLVATDVQRVWTLDQDAHLLHAKVPTYLADPTFAATFRVAERTTYDGGLTLYLLVRR